jgi:hypothetical protein
MSEKRDPLLQSLPVANYSVSIARAVEWLGDRYLLATPMNASRLRSNSGRAVFNRFSHSERYGPEGATYWVARRTLR